MHYRANKIIENLKTLSIDNKIKWQTCNESNKDLIAVLSAYSEKKDNFFMMNLRNSFYFEYNSGYFILMEDGIFTTSNIRLIVCNKLNPFNSKVLNSSNELQPELLQLQNIIISNCIKDYSDPVENYIECFLKSTF